MSFKLKKWSTHVQDVSKRLGLAYATVDQILKAYIEDLRDTLKSGTSVKLDRLVTIHVCKNAEGTGYKTASAVSKPLRKELAYVCTSECTNVKETDDESLATLGGPS